MLSGWNSRRYHNGLDDIVKFYEDLARSIAITECTFDFVPVEFQLKPTHSDSDDENSSFSGFSDIDSEDEPLSRLSSKLKKLSKDKHAHYKEEPFKSVGLEDDLDQLSDQEELNSSGSEYKPTKFEKKMMASQMSSSNLDSSESSVLLSPKMKHKKLKKRKTKGQKSETNMNAKQNKHVKQQTKKVLSNKKVTNLKATINPQFENKQNPSHAEFECKIKRLGKKLRGGLRCQLSDMRKIKAAQIKTVSVDSHKRVHYGCDKRSVVVQNEVIGITPGEVKYNNRDLGSSEVQNEDVGMGSEEGPKEARGKGSEVRYAIGNMMSGEVQNKDEGMGSEEVRYATGDMMSGEDQNEDRGMGSEEVRYATGDMMAEEVQNEDGGIVSEEVIYVTGDVRGGTESRWLQGVRGGKICNRRYDGRGGTE